MNIFDKYFKFPILMVDEINEVRKQEESQKFGELSGQEEELEFDIIVGEGEVQDTDTILFIGDKWKPNKASFNQAQDGKFNCCTVIFSYAGTFWVPMNKEKFKASYDKFFSTLPEKPQPVLVKLTKKTMEELMNKIPHKNEKPE